MCRLFLRNSNPYNGSVNLRHDLSTHSLGDEISAMAASGSISAQRRISKGQKVEVQNSEKLKLTTLNPGPPPPSHHNIIANAAQLYAPPLLFRP